MLSLLLLNVWFYNTETIRYSTVSGSEDLIKKIMYLIIHWFKWALTVLHLFPRHSSKVELYEDNCHLDRIISLAVATKLNVYIKKK